MNKQIAYVTKVSYWVTYLRVQKEKKCVLLWEVSSPLKMTKMLSRDLCCKIIDQYFVTKTHSHFYFELCIFKPARTTLKHVEWFSPSMEEKSFIKCPSLTQMGLVVSPIAQINWLRCCGNCLNQLDCLDYDKILYDWSFDLYLLVLSP